MKKGLWIFVGIIVIIVLALLLLGFNNIGNAVNALKRGDNASLAKDNKTTAAVNFLEFFKDKLDSKNLKT
ncbi:MAG: hypothetical protein V1824_03500 [archaeon]